MWQKCCKSPTKQCGDISSRDVCDRERSTSAIFAYWKQMYKISCKVLRQGRNMSKAGATLSTDTPATPNRTHMQFNRGDFTVKQVNTQPNTPTEQQLATLERIAQQQAETDKQLIKALVILAKGGKR